MPSVPIYIRQKDYEKWLAIENKPAFISKAINAESNSIKSIVVEPLKVHTSRAVQSELDTRIRKMAEGIAELNAAEVPTKDRSWVNEDGVDKGMVDELKRRGQVR